VRGDARKLSDAFAELIRNSDEAMLQSTGRASKIEIDVNLQPRTATTRAMALIEFADVGPGIKEADKDRLFNPLFTTKSRGSGLGLAIVKNIIVQHDGTIQEVGVLDAGARFVIRLPLVEHLEC
jgi:two-component system, NtrC family, sensor histidine kinase HydH